MAVNLIAVQKGNPNDLLAPKKFYAQAVANGEVGIDAMAELISEISTVSEADCYAVLVSLERSLIRELKNGRIVRLGRLGDFQISVSSFGSDVVEEVSASSVKKARILFKPSVGCRNMLKTLEYKKTLAQ
jgi:predicted histone-like DNA-binding protein